MKLKTLYLTTLVLVALVSLPTVYVAGASSSNFTVSQGIYPSAHDFTIYKEGGTYYAKTKYGAISYQGTNAKTVSQNVFNQNPSSVLYKGGATYYFDGTVLIPSSVTIEGEGSSSIIEGDGASGWALFVNKNYATYDMNIIVRNLYLKQGASNPDQILFLSHVHNSTVENLIIESSNKTCLRFDAGNNNLVTNNILYGGGISLGYGTNNSIVSSNLIKWVQTGHAIGISGGADASIKNLVLGNWVYNVSTGLGITIDGKSHHNTVSANYLENIQGDAINTEAWVGVGVPENNTISDNTVVNSRIALAGNSGLITQFNHVTGNHILDGTSDSLYIIYADHNVISDNTILQSQGSGIFLNYSSWNILQGNLVLDSNAYGIREVSNTDYNMIIGCTSKGSGNQDIWVIGANTECHFCFNGTTWIS